LKTIIEDLHFSLS